MRFHRFSSLQLFCIAFSSFSSEKSTSVVTAVIYLQHHNLLFGLSLMPLVPGDTAGRQSLERDLFFSQTLREGWR